MTVAEILRLSADERKQAYEATGIDKVIIDGNEFTDYKAFSFLWEKSYVKSPERSGDGSITNLNSYATFVTPHLKIDFSMMSIDSYRKLMELLYSKNEFVVSCYDIVKNNITTNKMYFATEEMPKLWTIARALNGEEWVELLGVQDYTVEMIGTNESLEKVSVLYYDDNGNLLYSQEGDKGTEVIINHTFVPTAGKKFEGIWETESGTRYVNGSVVFLNSEIKLKAKVINDNQYTLSFDYGIGKKLVTQTQGDLVSIPIQNGEKIRTAIQNANIKLDNGETFVFPREGTGAKSVEYDGKIYEGSEVYAFRGWHWTSSAGLVSLLDENTVFDYTINRTIYQIYVPTKKKVVYNTNTNDAISIADALLGYGETVYLPTLARTGYTHNGWYTTPDFKDGTAFSGTMPPYALTLYAKWVKNQ